jgi:hypothetical protein
MRIKAGRTRKKAVQEKNGDTRSIPELESTFLSVTPVSDCPPNAHGTRMVMTPHEGEAKAKDAE